MPAFPLPISHTIYLGLVTERNKILPLSRSNRPIFVTERNKNASRQKPLDPVYLEKVTR